MQNNTFSTLFVGQNLIKLSAVDSTNNFLKRMVSNSEPLPEGTVIMAENQYAGRGQAESSWLAEPGKNLTFSLLLQPGFLPLGSQFRLNMAVSVAIQRALKALVGEGLTIKWPNDIYYGDQKLGGILIENMVSGGRIKACIIGIGLNVNQEVFEGDLGSRAGSVYQILHEHVNLIWLLTQICSHIEAAYLKLREGRYLTLREEYLECLYLFHTNALYRQNGELFEGRIVDVSDTGFLSLETEAGIKTYNFKEIEFINQPK
ncbi:biotin--[acetyl-CoA-carboxylase] ligase [Pedobacter sp. MC2016-15]|uniref:biotin--[acetyl-CoA-carboxylase] ligase n=1 Tax=Pedobacter sp. MC2016-15 TaxID=2994473 RepID=UPI00224785B7|nr:biotin--[acetyl-CoA-carboxylase] ligase [Pedobacter sp. MC2016-15]MCX2478521.1 biotin--[acetyl-CoA-carboxylase] ligase [Pedobacter sp. MC2016-15]